MQEIKGHAVETFCEGKARAHSNYFRDIWLVATDFHRYGFGRSDGLMLQSACGEACQIIKDSCTLSMDKVNLLSVMMSFC